MTAREMFEELGYTCLPALSLLEHKPIIYSKELAIGKYVSFNFRTGYKDVLCNCDDDYLFIVDMPTFKAIQKQLEELGWLDVD